MNIYIFLRKFKINFLKKTAKFSQKICEATAAEENIPLQKFVNRSDQRGGSTIGPIISTQIHLNAADIGNPLLAMHSIRELAGVMDLAYSYKLFNKFFSL